ncbi:hypothetical protein BDZ89DRAFT_1146935 [Hymenopellis radicata]|nr:hypothetical protein BDZ89DRAFT_1146935 [Hymenopellis radicata]
MEEPRIRYFAEKRLKSSGSISVAAFSDACSYLALACGSLISVVVISGDVSEPLYYQEGGSDVTALLWLSDTVLIAGYLDGTFVTTRITYTQIRVQGQALGLRAFANRGITVLLKGPSRKKLILASGDTVQIWRSAWLSRCRSGPPRWTFDKELTLPAYQPIFKLAWSYRSPKDIYVVHPHGVIEWDVRNNKQSEIVTLPQENEIVGISWDGRWLISVTQHVTHRKLNCLDLCTRAETRFSYANLDIDQHNDANLGVSIAFAHDNKRIVLGSSRSQHLILWDVCADDREVLKMTHDCTPDPILSASTSTVSTSSSTRQRRSKMSLQDFERQLLAQRGIREGSTPWQDQSGTTGLVNAQLPNETQVKVEDSDTPDEAPMDKESPTPLSRGRRSAKPEIDSVSGSRDSQGEVSVPKATQRKPAGPKCSLCGETGHNRRTCPLKEESEQELTTPVLEDYCNDSPKEPASDSP